MQDNIDEIQNNLASLDMVEDPAVGRSLMADKRVRPDHFKGLSSTDREAILQEQAAQRQQAAERKARAKEEDAEIDAQMERIRKLGVYNDAQVAALRAEMRKQLMEENQALAASQFASNSYLNTQIFKNEIDPSFFDQFNNTSR